MPENLKRPRVIKKIAKVGLVLQNQARLMEQDLAGPPTILNTDRS